MVLTLAQDICLETLEQKDNFSGYFLHSPEFNLGTSYLSL